MTMFAQPDFQKIFEAVPGLYLVLSPTLIIVAASNAYLQATMTRREDLIGRAIFDVFPDNPDDPNSSGVANLRHSLMNVLHGKRYDAMAIQKYDVRRPVSEGGQFEVRYWSPFNSPVFDQENNIQFIIHCVEDVTEFIQLRDQDRDREQAKLHDLLEKNESMEAEIYRRAQQVAETNRHLVAANTQLEQVNNQLQERNTSLLDANYLLAEAKKRVVTLLAAYERAEQIATRFQEAALPVTLPKVPGFHFDAYYRPGPSDALVGGDWYDAVRLSDGRLVISIGDVGGSGLSAAVIMATMRQVIRGVSYIHPDPAMILDAANKALQSEHPDIYVTAFVGIIDPIEMVFTYASAGHPPPILRHADGSLEELVSEGALLGVLASHTATSHEKTLPSRSKLIFYTDGLIEATHNNQAGEKKLYEVLADATIVSQPRMAAEMYEQILGQKATDDVAILVVDVSSPSYFSKGTSRQGFPSYWALNSSDAAAAHEARSAFSASLKLMRAGEADCYSAELVFGELIGNVARHAPGTMEIFVDWDAENPVLHVIDQGPGFTYSARLPHDILSESGRGLYLIDTLTTDFNVTRKYGGGSHARAVISLRNHQFV